MYTLKVLLVAVLAILFSSGLSAQGSRAGPGGPGPGALDPVEESNLVFMREEEKFARDAYRTLYGTWDDTIFLTISWSEQRHMDAMKRMLEFYAVDDPVVSDETGVFSDPRIDVWYARAIARGSQSLTDALHVGARIEEVDIRDLRTAIANTDEEPLLGAYRNLLGGARNHLRAFVARIEALGIDYLAQELEQEDVDTIVDSYGTPPPGSFSINPGLNDVWYDPSVPGQGFSISIFPGQQTVFLLWFTYDTELPDVNDDAVLGDAGQRWLTASGAYSGADAELEIGVMSGGLFDSGLPIPQLTPGGSILLHFDSCNSATVFYDMPDLGLEGRIPIRRINERNVAQCSAMP